MWINRIQCCLLTVAHLCILNHFVYSQESAFCCSIKFHTVISDSSYKAENLTCITHNLVEVICTWTTDSTNNLGVSYEFCYTIRRQKNCSVTEEKSQEFPLITFDSFHIEISTLNSSEKVKPPIATNTFLLTEKDIKFVPPTPRIHRLTPDFISDTLELEWYDGGSNFPYEIDASWEIQILYKDPMEEVTLITYSSTLTGNDTLLHWKWTSDLPFNCTTHYVRIRCLLHENTFAGMMVWSEWSQPEHIPGKIMEKIQALLVPSPAGKLDVWREKSANEGTVIIFWKPLPIPDRNGVIQGYEVSWIVPEVAMKKQSVSELSNSIEVKLGRNDYIFTVVAKNKAGFSSPSLINSAEIPVGPVPTETGVATEDGIQVSWLSDPSVTCGYTVRWCYGPEPCTAVSWETFPSSVTNPVIRSALFQPGVRYHFSVYGCKDNGYQLLKYIDGYTKELEPAVAPLFNVELTTSDSILIKWQDIPTEKTRGFIKGYLLHFGKGEEGTTKPKTFESGHRAINITDPEQKTLKISSLQGKTGYHLNLSGYTAGGIGPARSLYVVTKENAVGLIIAILIPVAIVVVLAVVTSILCYRKREWIKETFYPDIPNPENCKALEFPKDPEGNPNSKTLEMNPCTPNNIEVVETQSSCLKIEDATITLPVTEELPEDGLDSESESHIVVSYCPSIIEEEISNPPIDGSVGSSQVVYIDIQTMYPASEKMKEDLEVDCVVAAGYKPQMQPPRNTEETTSVDEDLDKAAGYRPQVNAPSWNTDCPDSPVSMESNNENASFGSPCSINSRQFLIPPKEDEDSPEVINTGWSFSNFFHNKPND
ncbi:hypothetical protein JD844_008452 [Phrynosoma platyrhinos]|uniref:Fibronectin type-III domain-containing protein n=1 Tax=Phrynosoma platyrhinos TaxID=52577 RepID=A0ABQ7TE40_PHRPL|nr:hypothetical protein JD844_008452 [Phrynosoma platyrhinos]